MSPGGGLLTNVSKQALTSAGIGASVACCGTGSLLPEVPHAVSVSARETSAAAVIQLRVIDDFL